MDPKESSCSKVYLKLDEAVYLYIPLKRSLKLEGCHA
jgi:hypothetical protein